MLEELMTLDKFLEHAGVKGMKWGVRKSDKSIVESGKGWSISNDGEINLDKGAIISRVVRNNNGMFGGRGHELDSGRPLYASFKPVDTVAYEHFFGSAKGMFVKEASAVVKFRVSEPIKVPGPKKATELFFDMVNKDPEAKKLLKSNLTGMVKFRLDKTLTEPDSRAGYNLYTAALDSGNYNAKLKPLSDKYYAKVQKAGYNALLDSSDAAFGFDAPIIVLNAKQSLTTEARYVVDKLSANNARLSYRKEAAAAGKTYLERLGYV